MKTTLSELLAVAFGIAWLSLACETADTFQPPMRATQAGGGAMTDMAANSAGRVAAPATAGVSGERDAGARATMNARDDAGHSDEEPTMFAGAGGMPSRPSSAGTGGAAGMAGGSTPTTPMDAGMVLGGEPWVAGDYPPDPMSATYLDIAGVAGQKGYTRQYKVHIPPSYNPSIPTPVVFCIHGLTQDAVLFCVIGSSMIAKSDKEGFVLVMPNGYGASWNGGTCCGAASVEQLDDVALMRAIFADISKHVNVDRSRVYATGHSNGGFMSYRLACDAADIFTAVAPSAGGIGTNEVSAMWELVESGSLIGATNSASDFTVCAPSQPISVLDLHGTDDGLVPHSFQQPSIEIIAKRNGCAATTRSAEDPMSRGDTTCVSYDGCPNGLEVTGCTVQGGGHNWFGSPDCGTAAGELGCAIVGYNSSVLVNTEAVWNFFERHSR